MRGVTVLGMRREGLDSEYTVTSSSSYLKSSEIKAGNSEVRRVPGNGFSSCAVPTFSRVQGISNGGRNRFPEFAGMESVPEQFRVQVRRREKRRFGVRIVRRCAECARKDLAHRKSQVERDKIRVEFDIQNAETYMTRGTYILDETKSGMHEE